MLYLYLYLSALDSVFMYEAFRPEVHVSLGDAAFQGLILATKIHTMGPNVFCAEGCRYSESICKCNRLFYT